MSYTKRWIEDHPELMDQNIERNAISWYEYEQRLRIAEFEEMLWQEQVRDNVFVLSDGEVIENDLEPEVR